jgi:hypothetical protein
MSTQTTQTEQTEQTTAQRTPRVVTPKLRCIVTGKERLTNKAYLDTKASEAGVAVDVYLKNYISREPLRLLREGKTLAEVRTQLNATITDTIADADLQAAIKMNGKWSKTK